mmetsp:Transcript_15888/g.24471  ORF Transcript_15888/g.24471 Transcript_15888/m.24471 type:complete len:80 (+) Transcript_15888:723-962(+)
MFKHVRKYIPAHYKNLVSDWPAIAKWGDLDYLKFVFGQEYLEASHYDQGFPFRNYAGGHVFTNQRGTFETIEDFLNIYQ